MSITLELLDRTELAKKIEVTVASRKKHRSEFLPTEQLKQRFVSGANHERDGSCAQVHYLRSGFRLAQLLHANGGPPAEIRQMLSEAVREFATVVPLFDYSPFEARFAVHKSQAAKYDGKEMPHDLGQVFLAPSPSLGSAYQTVTVKVNRQPAQIEMKEALQAALIAHDFETARAIASAYKLLPPVQGARANHLGVLREGILGRTELALQHLETIYDGYSPDFPPDRKEVADGVIRKDAKQIKKGLKAATTRFQTAWKLKTYCTPAKLRRLGSVEKMLPKVRSHLINHHWMMSNWVIAWMSLADYLKIKEAFEEPKLFCEWIPWELCSEAPNPLAGHAEMTTKKAPAKLGKKALKEALEEAIEADDATEIENLLKAGADIEAKDLSKRTPLIAAATKGKVNAIQALLKGKAQLKATDPQERNALSWAAEKGSPEVIQLLLDAGAKVDEGSPHTTHLLYAIKGGNSECVRVLLGAGANPNKTGYIKEYTPIAKAAESDNETIVDLLIKAGADVTQPANSNCAPILMAAAKGNIKILQALIAARAEVMTHYNGFTPLHDAARGKHPEAVSFLIKEGADVNALDSGKSTPLHEAAGMYGQHKNSAETMKVLIKAGAKVNAQTNWGQTPLMAASYWPERIEVLVAAGADPTIKDHEGKTVFDLIEDCPESLAMLAKLGHKA
jgi:ankyrin repeat protein